MALKKKPVTGMKDILPAEMASYAEASPRTAGRYSLKGRILPKKKNTVVCAESDGYTRTRQWAPVRI